MSADAEARVAALTAEVEQLRAQLEESKLREFEGTQGFFWIVQHAPRFTIYPGRSGTDRWGQEVDEPDLCVMEWNREDGALGSVSAEDAWTCVWDARLGADHRRHLYRCRKCEGLGKIEGVASSEECTACTGGIEDRSPPPPCETCREEAPCRCQIEAYHAAMDTLDEEVPDGGTR